MLWFSSLFHDIKTPLIVILTLYLSLQTIWAADTTSAEFSALISDGSCELSLSETTLNFGIHRATEMPISGTVALQPLKAEVRCSSATTPTLSVSGTPLTSSAVPRAVIFRDTGSVSSGVGFMVRRDNGGVNAGNFYDISAAMANDEPVKLPAIQGDTVYSEPLLLGLVRAASEPVMPGSINATLTFRVTYE